MDLPGSNSGLKTGIYASKALVALVLHSIVPFEARKREDCSLSFSLVPFIIFKRDCKFHNGFALISIILLWLLISIFGYFPRPAIIRNLLLIHVL
jgi:hypothetical protein